MEGEEWKEDFDRKFGKFYIQAFEKSRELYYSKSGGSSNAICDFECGEDFFTASEDIKYFIKYLLQEERSAMREKAIACLPGEKECAFNANDFFQGREEGFNDCREQTLSKLSEI